MTAYQHTESDQLNRFQQSAMSDIRQLKAMPLSGAHVLTGLQMEASVERAVETGLPVVSGYIVCRAQAAVQVYDNGITSGTIKLVCDKTTEINLLVF